MKQLVSWHQREGRKGPKEVCSFESICYRYWRVGVGFFRNIYINRTSCYKPSSDLYACTLFFLFLKLVLSASADYCFLLLPILVQLRLLPFIWVLLYFFFFKGWLFFSKIGTGSFPILTVLLFTYLYHLDYCSFLNYLPGATATFLFLY